MRNRLRAERLLFCLACAAALGFAGTGARAAPGKLDARLRMVRAASPAQRLSMMALGGVVNERTVSVLLRLKPGTGKAALERAYPRALFRSQAGTVVTATVPLSLLDAFEADPAILQVELGRRMAPTLDVARSSTTSGSLFLGVLPNGPATDLPAGIDGSGVVIGIVDSGIDWSHRDFVIDVSSTSRVLSIWDQTITADADGPTPTTFGFNYGSEISQAQLTNYLRTGQFTSGSTLIRSSDTLGHGTHVAGIAAGDGTSTNTYSFIGMAPKADIIMVRTSFLNLDILDGLSYIVQKAAQAGKRAVINLSLGGQSGPHDGTDIFDTGVAAIAASTPVVVAMGNDHDGNPHARANFIGPNESTFTANTASSGQFIDAEFWHPGADGYTVSISLTCSPQSSCGNGNLSRTSGQAPISGSIGSANVFISDDDPADPAHPAGDKMVFTEVEDTAGVILAVKYFFLRTAIGGSGRVDGFVQPQQQGVKWSNFIDTTLTMEEPATADNVIAVGAYNSRNCWRGQSGSTFCYSPGISVGQIADFSGRGPTRDGRQKPDIAAPGQAVASALSSATTPSPNAGFITFDGKHVIEQGTSMAAPVVAGFVALTLQVNPNSTVSDVVNTIHDKGRVDAAVTSGGSLPNEAWGYGKLMGAPGTLAAPGNFTVNTLGVSSISWTWSTVANASSYKVFYATAPSSFIATVLTNSFAFTGLAPNTFTGIFVTGSNLVGDGPGATGTSTATYSAPIGGAPVLTASISSITVTYTPCAGSECSGYTLYASTASNFSGTILSSGTPNKSLSQLVLANLASLTTYYMRLATLNSLGAETTLPIGSTQTLNFLGPPGLAPFTNVGTSSIKFNWTQGTNPGGLTYSADASTAPNFTGTVSNVTGANLFSNTFTGLLANTSYFFRVRGGNGPYVSTGPVSTLAVPPGTAVSTFTPVFLTSFTVNWGLGLDPAGTRFIVRVGTAADFTGSLSSAATTALSSVFTGLSANTTYFARVQAVSHDGTPTAFTSLASTSTLAEVPALASPPFSGPFNTGFTGDWSSAQNGPGTLYLAQVSTASNFSAVAASSGTRNPFATFSALIPNQFYFFRVRAVGNGGEVTAFSVTGATITLPVPPAAGAAPSNRTTSSLRMSWTANGNASGTQFTAEISPDAGFSAGVLSSATANQFADFTGLAPNTTYYLRAQAVTFAPPNPDSPFAGLGTAVTFALPPTAAASTFLSVTYSSVTVNWTPAASAAGYRAQVSTDSGFGGTLFSQAVYGGASSLAAVGGLAFSTTYFLRVGSLDWAGDLSFVSLGSTRTLVPVLSSNTVLAGGLTLSHVPAYPTLTAITVSVPPGVLPPGTVLTINSSVQLDLPPPRTNQGQVTPLGTAVGFSLSAGGAQPNGRVSIRVVYDPLLVPLGQDPKLLELARYDDASGQWTFLPGSVDTSARVLTASVDHFSFFSPFFVAAAGDLSGVNVFPIPWEIGSSNNLFNAATLTFSNLPADARVRLFTVNGDLVWEGEAAANGILDWNGDTRYGRKAASATYLAVIESGKSRLLRRVVVIR